MKLFSFLLATMLIAGQAFALDASWSPFREKVAARIEALESGTVSGEGISPLRVARAIYSVSADGGNSGVTYPLGVYLPARSLLLKGWYRVDATTAQSGTVQNTGTLAIGCEDSGNILNAQTISGVTTGTVQFLNMSGAATTAFVSGIANTCNIAVTVARANYTAGKITLWIEYVTHE